MTTAQVPVASASQAATRKQKAPRDRGTGGEPSGHPGHGVGEDLTFDPELHRRYLPFTCGPAA